MRIKQKFVVLLLCFLSGCAAPPIGGLLRLPPGSTKPPLLAETGELGAIQKRLLAQHESWRGTPYVLGGESRRGIDCSAFVQITYAQHFSETLPRSTEQQVRAGTEIDRRNLVPGDLVFFRTGKTNHVGMMLGSGWFLHAGSSTGVTVNHITDAYWAARYWTARRVL